VIPGTDGRSTGRRLDRELGLGRGEESRNGAVRDRHGVARGIDRDDAALALVRLAGSRCPGCPETNDQSERDPRGQTGERPAPVTHPPSSRHPPFDAKVGRR